MDNQNTSSCHLKLEVKEQSLANSSLIQSELESACSDAPELRELDGNVTESAIKETPHQCSDYGKDARQRNDQGTEAPQFLLLQKLLCERNKMLQSNVGLQTQDKALLTDQENLDPKSNTETAVHPDRGILPPPVKFHEYHTAAPESIGHHAIGTEEAAEVVQEIKHKN